jgi:hypothetical protein
MNPEKNNDNWKAEREQLLRSRFGSLQRLMVVATEVMDALYARPLRGQSKALVYSLACCLEAIDEEMGWLDFYLWAERPPWQVAGDED